MEATHQSTISKLLENPSDFRSEYVDKKIEATREVASKIAELVESQEGLLSPVEGARTIAAAVGFGVWGLDEFIATASPGPSFAVPELMGSRQSLVHSGSS